MAVVACLGQVSRDDFRRILSTHAGFPSGDLVNLDAGKTVVRTLSSDEKREVAVIGVVRLNNLTEPTMSAFRASLTQKNSKVLLGEGRFSLPPKTEDLTNLTYESRDIDELKNCEVGNCDLKLSAEMIKRAKAELDWTAADAKSRAGQLMSAMLTEYVSDYLVRGDKALIQVASRKDPVRLADEHHELLDDSILIKEFAPDFRRYMSDFPAFRLAGVDSSMSWSKVNLGVKPFVTITQTTAYTSSNNGLPQFILANKQIFATRYIESSLAFSFLVSFTGDAGRESYLVFTDRSRSDALEGAFGSVKRALVEKQAYATTVDLLSRAKYRLENGGNDRQTEYQKVDGLFFDFISIRMIVFSAVGICIIAALLLFVYKRRQVV